MMPGVVREKIASCSGVGVTLESVLMPCLQSLGDPTDYRTAKRLPKVLPQVMVGT
jgi:hypothetical protein